MKRATTWDIYGRPLLGALAAVQTIRGVVAGIGQPCNDFCSFYDSAMAFWLGQPVYTRHVLIHEPNLNAPSVIVAMLPIVALPVHVALIVCQAVQATCLIAACWLTARELGLKVGTVLAATFATAATGVIFHLGQITGVLALAATAAWLADRRGHAILAGALLGPLIYAKPFLLVFLPWWVWRREWRATAATMATALLAAVPGLVVLGPAGYREWVHALRTSPPYAHAVNASIEGLVRRVFGPATALTTPLAAVGHVELLWLGLSAVAGVLVVRRIGTRSPADCDPSVRVDDGWLALLLFALLVSPVGWIYYLTLAIGPAAAVASRTRADRSSLVRVSFALLCLPTIGQMLYGSVMTATYLSAYAYGLMGLFLAHTVRAAPACRAQTTEERRQCVAVDASRQTPSS